MLIQESSRQLLHGHRNRRRWPGTIAFAQEASMASSQPLRRARAQLAEELLAFIPAYRETSWSSASLGLDARCFAALVQRLFELEADEVVDILSVSRHTSAGAQVPHQIKFVRLA
jgi:hypothetical protein